MAYSPNRVTIDLSALKHNLNQVKRLVGPDTKIMGIVKSEAYGHGLVRVAQVLEQEGVYSIGVAHLDEALELREQGIKLPIVLLCGIGSGMEEAREVAEKNLTAVVYDISAAELLDREASKRGKRINIHLKIDTGMGRLGVHYSEAGAFIKKIQGLSGLNLEGLMSHLSSADDPDREFTEQQIRNFKEAVNTARALGRELSLNNLANSAGIMAHRGSHFEMVRPGIMLYGGSPSPGFSPPLPLKPVMTFTGEVLQIRDLPDQTPVSYGRRYYTEGTRKMAVISAGYGDGLPRALSKRGKVLLGGKRADIRGTICMNMLICDVTGINNIRPGDEAVFLGAQGEGLITGDEIAGWVDTISYEIFISIGQGKSRNYVL
jgi:alanine racemase